MAITSLAGIVAGLQPPYEFLKVIAGSSPLVGAQHSYFYRGGHPTLAAAPTPGLAGAALTTYTGQIPWTNPASGYSYIARFACNSSIANVDISLADRLWHNSGITITQTTAHTINSVAWPARDRDGTTNGEGVCVGLEVSATLGNGAVTNTTLDYTNSAGTSGRTGTITSFVAAAVTGTFVQFELQAGDKGVRSIQGLTLGTSYVSGTMHLVAYRPLLRVGLLIGVPQALDPTTGGFPRCYDNTVPFLLSWHGSNGTAGITGQLVIAQG